MLRGCIASSRRALPENGTCSIDMGYIVDVLARYSASCTCENSGTSHPPSHLTPRTLPNLSALVTYPTRSRKCVQFTLLRFLRHSTPTAFGLSAAATDALAVATCAAEAWIPCSLSSLSDSCGNYAAPRPGALRFGALTLLL
jgi:hypothetical protein